MVNPKRALFAGAVFFCVACQSAEPAAGTFPSGAAAPDAMGAHAAAGGMAGGMAGAIGASSGASGSSGIDITAGVGAAAQGPRAGAPGTTDAGGAAADAGTQGSAGSGAPPADASVPDDSTTPAEDGGLPRHTGPGDWGPGDYPPGLDSLEFLEISGVPGQSGYVRQYKVHVPPSYQPEVPMPLVFCIHGLGQDALLFCLTGAAMDKKSDEGGFILVMPNGYLSSWNAGTCCGAASDEQLDDVALFRAIFDEVSRHLNIDLDRVYALGLSNGGYMSYRLACEAADLFTAVAPSAAAIGINDVGGGTNLASDFVACTPSRPVSILDVHGTADPLIPYELQAPTLAIAAMNGGCGTATRPAEQPLSAGDTSCVSYEGCSGGIELTACSVEGGGHCWFGSPDCGTGGGAIGLAIVGANSDAINNTDAAWDFLKRQRRR